MSVRRPRRRATDVRPPRAGKEDKKEVAAMFWNDPNLYGYTYREVPNIPTPFFGQLPKLPFYGMTPWTTPQVPPITPFYGMNLRETLPVPPITPFYGMNLRETLPVPPINPFYGMNLLQVLPHLAQQQIPFLPQVPQFNPLAFYGLPYRPF
ncbi:MAG TPA: hypothetical protein VFO11_06680 [Candidatus Polarisedimenticolaceae bacterium]|nr:hypothetical protein [Candidatus Polarisedimenticolaceae bacterium]